MPLVSPVSVAVVAVAAVVVLRATVLVPARKARTRYPVGVVPASSVGGTKATAREPLAAVMPVIEGAVAVCDVSVGVTGDDEADAGPAGRRWCWRSPR